MMTLKQQIKTVLQISKSKLQKEDNWCKNATALDKNNNKVSPTSKDAVKFCSLGIIRNVLSSERYHICFSDVYSVLETATISKFKTINSPTLVNDGLGHKAVIDIYDEAIKIIDEE